MSDVQTLRWYTRARKLPRLIGKLPGGGQIIGGPYTPVQFVGAAAVIVVGNKTMGLWGMWSGLVNYVILGVAAIATLFGLGLVKSTGRNPLTAGFSLASALVAPRLGRYRGKAVKMPKPHRVSSRVVCPVRASGAPTLEVAAVTAQEHDEPVVAAPAHEELVSEPAISLEDEIFDMPAAASTSAPAASALDSIPARSKVPMSNIQRALVDLNLEGRAS